MPKVNVFGKPIEYDVGVTIVNGDRSPHVIKEGDDLSILTKQQLAQYAHDSTLQNDIPVDASPTSIVLVDLNGIPSLPTDTANSNEFSKTLANDKTYSNTEAATFFHKGHSGDSTPNGNTLLSNQSDKIASNYTSPILKRNRFNADSPQIATNNFRMNPDHPKETLGSYQAFLTSKHGKDFSDGHLAHIGAGLSLRSTRELLAATRTGYGPDGPDGAGAAAASILPGLTQAGLLKVSTSDLEVKDVLNQIIAADTTVANLDPSRILSNHTVLEINDSSYGQMNNVLEPFSGLLPLGMLGLSIALVLALKLALKGILIIFATITSAGKSVSSFVDKNGRKIPGKYVVHSTPKNKVFGVEVPIPLPATLFGLHESIHPYSDCVDRGMEDFFGGKISDVGSSLARILESPGFYATFCRSIVRSASTIVDDFKKALSGNPIQIAQNIIALVDIIKQSKIVAALNMFAAIGDNSLNLEDLPAYKALEDKNDSHTRLSVIDSLTDDSSAGFKNRLNGKLQLAWSTSNTPSAFIIPDSFLKSLSVFSQIGNSQYKAGIIGTSDKFHGQGFLVDDSKIDPDVVLALEAKLDAEYMPFYFHDLRTNEIIGFPAFLTSISDDFQVNYEGGDYYGRVDQVKIYKSTHRKISVGFNIVATNEDDFDEMWMKINKLVTMVYPQWTEGTVLNNKDANVKMIQPFSQLPGASPVIRLRLGDLFRSNYSRFALARLFGLGSKNFAIDSFGELSDTDPSFLQHLAKMYAAAVNDPLKAKEKFKFMLQPGSYSEGSVAPSSPGLPIPPLPLLEPAKPKQLQSIPQPVVVEFLGIDATDSDFCVVDIVDESVKSELKIEKPLKVPASVLKMAKGIEEFKDNVRLYTDGKELVKADISLLQKFFDSEGNTIIKSFEAVGGKGLACTIDTLNFGWLDNIPWETATYGSRAPKICRVSISLTPIHDIAPGIDSNGFDRAPVYSVGGITRQYSGDANDSVGLGKAAFDKIQPKNVARTKR